MVSHPDLNVDAPDYFEYTVSGMGMETITITPDGEITFSGNDAAAEIAFSMPCDSLGDNGFIRLFTGTITTATVSIDVENGKIYFSGLNTGNQFLSYAGDVSNPLVTVDLSVGTGSLDLNKLNMGQLILAEDGCEEQIIAV